MHTRSTEGGNQISTGPVLRSITGKAYLKIIFPFSNILRENKRTRGKIHWVEETASVQHTVIQRHQVAKSRSSATTHSALQCASICKAANSQCRANAHISINRLPSSRHRPPEGWFGPYLCIVLKHLIALHVVALEHEDGSVKAGDVQTEVICSYFFIGSVREHLENSRRNKKRVWLFIIGSFLEWKPWES